MARYLVVLVDLLVKYGLDKLERHGTFKEGVGWFLGDAVYELFVRSSAGGIVSAQVGSIPSQILSKTVLMTIWEIVVMMVIGGFDGRHKWLWALLNNAVVATADVGYFKALDWWETAPATQ